MTSNTAVICCNMLHMTLQPIKPFSNHTVIWSDLWALTYCYRIDTCDTAKHKNCISDFVMLQCHMSQFGDRAVRIKTEVWRVGHQLVIINRSFDWVKLVFDWWKSTVCFIIHFDRWFKGGRIHTVKIFQIGNLTGYYRSF